MRFRTAFNPLLSLCRWRHHPDPGTLEQRLFRAVTQPVLIERPISPTEKYLRLVKDRTERIENNPYKNFLIRKCREDVFEASDGRMLLIHEFLFHRHRELVPFKNKLFKKGIIIKIFPNELMREAAKGTKWESVANTLLVEKVGHMCFIGDPEPALCKSALTITKRAHFLHLVGAVIGHRVMTCAEVRSFSQLNTLPLLHSEMVGILQAGTSETSGLLNHHQNELSRCLQQLTEGPQDGPVS